MSSDEYFFLSLQTSLKVHFDDGDQGLGAEQKKEPRFTEDEERGGGRRQREELN